MADELAAAGLHRRRARPAQRLRPERRRHRRLFATTGSDDPSPRPSPASTPTQVTADLDAAADYGKKLPSANGKLFVAGFCWGGGKSFAFATHRKDLSAAFVFYGPPPPAADMKNINAPVYGFYAGNDARIGATVPAAITDMKAAGKIYEPVTYDGAGHGFMRAGQAPDAKPADKAAYEQGTARLLKEMAKASSGKGMALRRTAPARGRLVASGKSAKPTDCAAMHGM